MVDFLFTAIALLGGLLVHQVVLRSHQRPFEQRLLTRSFTLHMVSAIALIFVYQYYYGGGDMFAYQLFGIPITEALRSDFEIVAPQVWALFVHGEYTLPIYSLGVGSTGTMQAITVALLFLLGNSIFAAAIAISTGSYVAKVFIYRAIRPEFPESAHERALFASTLSPTAIVWTCALLKEPVLMVFLGPAFVGLRWFLDGRRVPTALAMMAVSGWCVALVKPYVLIAFGLGAGAWIFARTLKARGNLLVKPIYVLAAAAAVVLGFLIASSFYPGLSPDQLTEAMKSQRHASAQEVGGSNFTLEEPEAPSASEPEPGFFSELRLVPLALITAFFRPFLFESFSPLQFLNSIEMTWLTVLFIQVVRRNSWSGLIQRVMSNPALVFSLTFCLVLALGTGLSTANLGTLSRYRAPMMPFFLLLLLTLRQRESSPQALTSLPEADASLAA